MPVYAAVMALLFVTGVASGQQSWSPAAAANYLDKRASWWMAWPTAARDHGTFCVSCHTLAPYAMARRFLRTSLSETFPSGNERKMLDNIVKRVRMWKDVEPFYPDQTGGLPKTSESRGTESILNALILVWNDVPSGRLTPDTRLALETMWALQLRSGEMSGSWAWLQFHNAPWEGDSQYYGSALAAVAIGSAPEAYRSEPGIQAGLKRLTAYLVKNIDAQTPADRVVLLWSSAKIPGLLTEAQQQKIVSETLAKQQQDGGFSLSTLVGSWKRRDKTPVDPASDGYATGLVAFAVQQGRWPDAQPALQRAVTWLSQNQNQSDGRWPASSLNKERKFSSDAGPFMSDAATAYAVMALENSKEH